jgi:hypothetical protein
VLIWWLQSHFINTFPGITTQGYKVLLNESPISDDPLTGDQTPARKLKPNNLTNTTHISFPTQVTYLFQIIELKLAIPAGVTWISATPCYLNFCYTMNLIVHYISSHFTLSKSPYRLYTIRSYWLWNIDKLLKNEVF